VRCHLGYYAHHHGAGHLRRADQVLAACRTPGTILTSSDHAVGDGVVRLPLDVGGPSAVRRLPSLLHHAPVGHRGLRARTAALATFLDVADPALLVVDVSVEVTLLARLAGVLPVVVRQHGARVDPPHRAAYEAAGQLLAFWPPWAEDPTAPAEVRDRTVHVGGASRLEGRAMPRETACLAAGLDPDARHVIVLRGFGGTGPSLADLEAAARATPDHRWTVLGRSGPPDRRTRVDLRGVVTDPLPFLSAADVVVTHAGQNAVSDAAAVGARVVVVPESRPFDEQHHLAAVLAAAGCAVVRPTWPTATDWPAVLLAAGETDTDRLRSYVAGGAARAAEVLDALVDELLGEVADDPGADHDPGVADDLGAVPTVGAATSTWSRRAAATSSSVGTRSTSSRSPSGSQST
jgi:hypothetical protein